MTFLRYYIIGILVISSMGCWIKEVKGFPQPLTPNRKLNYTNAYVTKDILEKDEV
jgi:hypothetical protein